MATVAMETAKMLKAIADVNPPHYFGTSVSMAMVANLKVNNIANLHINRKHSYKIS
jgi:hypothetical protein